MTSHSSYDVVRCLTLVVICTSLLAVVSLGLLGWRLWTAQAYLVPPGGPVWAKPGELDDVSARDYATAWQEARWTWRPDTFKERQEHLLASAHPTYRPTLKTELERDGRLVQQYELSSQLVVLSKHVVKRKHNIVHVAVHGRRTIWLGREQLPDEYVDTTLMLTLYEAQGMLKGIVPAGGKSHPPLWIAKPRKE